jgi:hypothetical protein
MVIGMEIVEEATAVAVSSEDVQNVFYGDAAGAVARRRNLPECLQPKEENGVGSYAPKEMGRQEIGSITFLIFVTPAP